MKSLLLSFIAISIFYTSNTRETPCNTCEYTGSHFHVRRDTMNNKYLPCSFSIDALDKGFIIDSCRNTIYSLYLKGHMSPIPRKPEKNVIVAFKKADRGYYEITDTLAKPDNKEEFSFYVHDKTIKCIGILQPDSTYVMFSATGFE